MIGRGRVCIQVVIDVCLPNDESLGFSYLREGLGLGLIKWEKQDQNKPRQQVYSGAMNT